MKRLEALASKVGGLVSTAARKNRNVAWRVNCFVENVVNVFWKVDPLPLENRMRDGLVHTVRL